MKRLLLWGIICVFEVGFLSLPAHADANNFTFSSFDADYYLGADSEGRSTLRTVETLTAEFPGNDQNHGIERAIPRVYDGHTTSLSIQSVTDKAGRPIPYEKHTDNNNEVLRIGNSDSYVHGTQVYKISYTQRDVTRYFSNTGKDEFYWDTNGTQWKQAFGSVTARVHMSDAIVPTFTKNIACYQGALNSQTPCMVSANGSVVTATATNLKAYETTTVALGFTPGTWRGYEPSLLDKVLQVWHLVQIPASVIAVILIIWFTVRFKRLKKRASEVGTIVPEYIPPKDASVLVSAQVAEGTRAEVAAQLIDLAVRHYVKVYQTSEKSLLKPAQYELEIVKSTDDLRSEERALVAALFGSETIGTRLAMNKLQDDYGVTKLLKKNADELKNTLHGEYDFYHKNQAGRDWYKKWGIGLIIVAIILLSPLLLVAGIVAFICAATLYSLTDKGLALERYVAGLGMYIKVGEKDRIAMLQSPEGAEKVGAGTADDSSQLVKLYERVLPYAVLLGQEKEWNNYLGVRYEQANMQPDWYVGNAAFNAAVFGTALNDFSSTLNSYTAPISSSSGGSGGGGYAGGGGGGGGGGGW